MKKYIILIFSFFLCCILIFAIHNNSSLNIFQHNDSDLKYYNAKCIKQEPSACARYLFLESWQKVKKESFMTNIDKQDWYYWKNRYLDKINTTEDAYVAVSTMLASLDDPYTRFLTPDESEDQNTSIAASISGIGVVISSTDGKITVEDIIEDSPAAKNDLKIGDIIVKINNESVAGFDIRKIANMIRGPIGTNVNLSVLRNGINIEKTIKRDKIKIKSVNYKMLENDIAYIRLSTFMSESAANEFYNAVQKTNKSKAIILDLRGNQGGLLTNAIAISNLLLQKGIVVMVTSKNKKVEKIKVQNVGLHIDKPMIVLTNGFTASAGEILAAALQENQRAYLVGEKTFGKGVIQRIIPLYGKTAMNVTIAKYLTPKGNDIHKKGINPDYEVKLSEKDIKTHNDLQLKKAVELLK